MIKAIILDIDGVIVGSKKGVNFPHPSTKVRKALKKIHDSGIPVSFITAKPTFSAAANIKAVGIDNPHIADNGGTLFNPIKNQIIHSTPIPKKDILKLLSALPKQTYVNLFSIREYYLQKNLKNNFTSRYAKIVEGMPKLITDLKKVAEKEDIPKINIVAFDDKEKGLLNAIVKKLHGNFSFRWTTHPFISPLRVMVMSAKKASKTSGLEMLAKNLGIPMKNFLGVGDTLSDWDFIKVCGYRAAMANGDNELKAKIKTSNPNQTIRGDVNKDGIIDIFKYFGLLK